MTLRKWICRSLEGDYDGEETIQARTEYAAAKMYANDALEDVEITKTVWFDVGVRCVRKSRDSEVHHVIEIDPEEPPCSSESGHDWREVYCQCHGGGVITKDVCSHCGRCRIIDGWATRPETGEQGFESIEYEEAEEEVDND